MKYKELDVSIGDALRTLRMQKHLTVRKVGEMLNIDNSTVSKWETGVSSISATSLKSYLDILGVSLSDFFNALGE